MKKLIINADDFGLHEAVNAAIAKGYCEGVITSTTLMPGAPAFADAVAVAKKLPGLGVGVHLTLVGERPVAPPSEVRSLVDDSGRFAAQYPQFLLRYLKGRVCLREIKLELMAQIEKVLQQGIEITHLDSHQHLHVFPGILEIVLELAAAYRIPALRIPAEPYLFSGGYPYSAGRWAGRCGLTFLAKRARQKAKEQGVLTTDHFFGMLAGGNMRQEYLHRIIASLPKGCSEIMIHPGLDSSLLAGEFGWPYAWEAELAAVCSDETKDLLEKEKVALCSYQSFKIKGTV